MKGTVKAWHFTADTLRDGRPIPPIGEWLVHEGPVHMCETGLHASVGLIDAMRYAPGWTLHRVECADIKARDRDKFVCRHRRIVATLRPDRARHVVVLWARACAWSVIDKWDAPEIVRQWLSTGDPYIRFAAADAASADAASAVAAAADAAYAAYAAAASAAAAYAAYAAAAAADAAAAAAADAARAKVRAGLAALLEKMVLREMGVRRLESKRCRP